MYNTMRMWQGVSGVAGEAGIVSPAYTVCCPEGEIHAPFISYLLKTPRLVSQFYRNSQGLVSDTWNLRYHEFSSIEIMLPPLEEQRRIAEILDDVDEQLAISRAVLAKEERLQWAALRERLTVPALGAGELGAYQRNDGYPRWVKIADVCRVSSGLTPARAEGDLYYAESGIPWVKTLDLNEGLLRATSESVTDIAVRTFGMRVYAPGTVLVAMYGGWAQIGRTGLLGKSAVINQAISALEVKGGKEVDPWYLVVALQSLRGAWRRVGISTRKDANITKSDVEEFMIPLPSYPDQAMLASVAAGFRNRAERARSAIEKLEQFKKSLLGQLVGCEV
ncbi:MULTISPECIES: restriction endonuclease subunit S [Streptomyces]|uniref:restriction endonuclease subunit S n=1 Tax=Streptomyces TaxID=1883 RepID=UPI001302630D|nr:restriction endonuclease subunit S [Streptomyces cacaoi]NNG84138.1 hypothetical protein [Streptomyces cacaoi]